MTYVFNDLFERLEQENAQLAPQESTAFILAQIERQNALLEKDPKSIYIHSNKLKAHFSTVQCLVKDNEDLGFWQAVIEDSDQVALKLPHLLSIKLNSGIPERVRGLIWQTLCKAPSLHLEKVYGQLCQERSPHEHIIQRDLARTFPRIDMFKQENGQGQISMKRVLEAYSLYDTEVGYCQGLAFLVGPLLMNMSETQSFCVFVRLMETYEMRSMFTLHMEGLQLRLYQFSQLFFEILPDLFIHFESHGVHAAMYASQWFLTLFAYTFPMCIVSRIYDVIFAEGAAETIMRVAISLLKRSTYVLMKMCEFEDLLDYITTSKLCLPYENYANIIRDAMALSQNITREKLDRLKSEYMMRNKKSANRFWIKSGIKRFSSHPTKISIKLLPAKKTSIKKKSNNKWSLPDEPDEACVTQANSLYSFGSLPMTPKSLESEEKLRIEHQGALNEIEKLKKDKKNLECERDALKWTILKLEKSAVSRLNEKCEKLNEELENFKSKFKMVDMEGLKEIQKRKCVKPFRNTAFDANLKLEVLTKIILPTL